MSLRWPQNPWSLGTCCYRSLKEARGHSSIQRVTKPLPVRFLAPLQTHLPLLLQHEKRKRQPLNGTDTEQVIEETSHPDRWQTCSTSPCHLPSNRTPLSPLPRWILAINKLGSTEVDGSEARQEKESITHAFKHDFAW